MTIGLAGIVLSLGLLMVLAYRGGTVIVLAPALAMLAVACSGEVPMLAAYTQLYMPALGTFLAKYFPLFLLGALFGALMDESGFAETIAQRISASVGGRHGILAVVLCVAVLTYGGVSVFVVAFATVPLARPLFERGKIPRRLMPAAIALGSATFTMTCLPGTMQIQNLIPMPYFGTTAFAAPLLGSVGGLAIFTLGMIWLYGRTWTAERRSKGDERHVAHQRDDAPENSAPARALSSIYAATAPIFCVLACNYVCSEVWIPTWSAGYLAEPQYGGVKLGDVRGTWSSIIALLTACASVFVLSPTCRARAPKIVHTGVLNALLPALNTASEVGYGATIKTLPAFATVREGLLNFFPNNPLISEAAAVSVLAGITGSASGGLSIALESLGATYFQRAIELGISPEVMHRVASIASGGFDTLPHNGFVITLLTICGLSHRESYWDIGMVTVIIPLITLGLVIGIAGF